MTSLQKLIKEMNDKHDEAISGVLGPLMAAHTKLEDINRNYTGDDRDVKEFYRDTEYNIMHLIEAFTSYDRTGTWAESDGEGDHP
jgi:hypothetical protein